MEAEYIYIGIGCVSFFVGLFFGINLVKFFSSEIIYKLENALEYQLKISESFLDDATQTIASKIAEKINVIEQINKILNKTKELLSENKTKVEILNNQCDTRKNLESEIIKLKKIIERLEKKR